MVVGGGREDEKKEMKWSLGGHERRNLPFPPRKSVALSELNILKPSSEL